MKPSISALAIVCSTLTPATVLADGSCPCFTSANLHSITNVWSCTLESWTTGETSGDSVWINGSRNDHANWAFARFGRECGYSPGTETMNTVALWGISVAEYAACHQLIEDVCAARAIRWETE